MATIASKHSAPTNLGRKATEAVVEVARALVACGFNESALIHGSAATRAFTFIECESIAIMAGDVDIVVEATITPDELVVLQELLDGVFRSALDQHASPRSRVSIKVANRQFLTMAEAPSLMLSAHAGGLSAKAIFQHHHARPTHTADVRFPFALQYGAWRWANLAAGQPSERMLGLYELTKGCLRARTSRATLDDCSLVSASELAAYVTDSRFLLRRQLPPFVVGLIAEVIESHDPLTHSSQAASFKASQAELRQMVRRTMPQSLLARRLAEQPLKDVA